MAENNVGRRTEGLLKGMLIYGVGIFGSKMISFFLLPLNTANLTPAEYGITDMVTVIISLLTPFTTLQLGMTMYKHLLLANGEKEKSSILSNGFFVNIIFSAIVSIASYPIFQHYYPDYVVIIASMLFMGGLNTTLLPVSRGMGRGGIYAITGCISTVVVVVVNAGIILFTSFRVEAVLLATLFSNIITVCFMIISLKLWRYIQIRAINRDTIIRMLKFGIPMIPRDICWWINNSFNRLILNRAKGDVENGYFVVTQKFTNLYGNAFSIVSNAWNDSAIANSGDGDREEYYNNFFRKIFRLMFCMFLLLLPLIYLCYDWLVDEQYNKAMQYIPLLMMGAVINQYADLYASVFLALDRTRDISTTAFLSTVVGAIVGIISIPQWGIWGIGGSVIVASSLMLIVRAYRVKKYAGICFPVQELWLVILAIVYILLFKAEWVQIPLLIIACLLSIYLNKDIIMFSLSYGCRLLKRKR